MMKGRRADSLGKAEEVFTEAKEAYNRELSEERRACVPVIKKALAFPPDGDDDDDKEEAEAG